MLIEEKNADIIRCCGPDSCGQATSIASNDRYCLGSACAGWRWYQPDPNIEPSDTDGYCGLAGRP